MAMTVIHGSLTDPYLKRTLALSVCVGVLLYFLCGLVECDFNFLSHFAEKHYHQQPHQ